MNRIFSFLVIIFVSVFTAGCVNINTPAVQKLNELANSYIEKGEYETGIARLESSLDLDSSIYETNYNLAIAYIKADNCAKALDAIDKAIAINQSDANAYYTKGVAQNCLANNLFKTTDSDGNIIDIEFTSSDDERMTAVRFIELLEDANASYTKYVDMVNDGSDLSEVKNHIVQNNETIVEYKNRYGI